MSSGDDIEAGRTATAESTTTLVGQRPSDLGAPFNGTSVLLVGSDEGQLRPNTTVDGIEGRGHRGGTGIIGTGGASGGTGVVAAGAAGSGPGLEATGGAATAASPTSTNRSPSGPGVVAVASVSNQTMTASESGNVGVFGQGGDAVEDTRNTGGANFTIGPAFAGAGVLGRGGMSRDNRNRSDPIHNPNGIIVPNGPVATIPGGPVGAGVVGISGGTATPAPQAFSNVGVFGTSDLGPGLSGVSRTDRGAVLESAEVAQLGINPALKNPQQLQTPDQDHPPLDGHGNTVGGRPGDILVTLVQRVEAVGNVDVAELWFCNSVDANNIPNWIKLA